VVDWKADRRLGAGTYYVHGGDIGPGGIAWSPVTSFLVVTPCIVPDVRGRTVEESRAALRARGCDLGAVRQVRSRRRPGRVVRTDPAIGTAVPPQTKVRLFVSAGPRRAATP
jgi:beta-lactam-binding protein with PASTA domain